MWVLCYKYGGYKLKLAMVTHSIYGLLQVEEGMIILGRLMEN